MKKVGLMGGTFDPIHNGHLLLARFALEAYQLDEIWFVPTGYSYFKANQKVTNANIRFLMTQAAISQDSDFFVSDVEISKPGNSYSFETLEALNNQYPDVIFFFLLGADCLYTIEKWYQPERIWANSILVAAARNGADLEDMRNKAASLNEKWNAFGLSLNEQKGYGQICILPFPDFDISSTQIRKRIRQGLSVRHLLPDTVITIIEQEGLYQDEK